MSLISDSNTADGKWEFADFVEVVLGELNEDGTPEGLETKVVENEITGQCSTAFSSIEHLGLCSELEQTEQLTENQAKCTKTVEEGTSEERKKCSWLSTELQEAEKEAYYPCSKRKSKKKVKDKTPEEQKKGLKEYEESAQPKKIGFYPGLKKQCKSLKKETPEEQEKRLSRNRELRKKKYKAKLENETPEEREERLEKIKNWRILREAKRSETDKQRIRKRRRELDHLKKATETPEERDKRLAWSKAYRRKRCVEKPRVVKQLSETERAIMLENNRIRYALRVASETPKEREKRIAKKRANEKTRPKRVYSPESLEALNERRRKIYHERKLQKQSVKRKPKWKAKMEAVEAAALPEPTDENHSLHMEVKEEPDDFQEVLLRWR